MTSNKHARQYAILLCVSIALNVGFCVLTFIGQSTTRSWIETSQRDRLSAQDWRSTAQRSIHVAELWRESSDRFEKIANQCKTLKPN